MHGRKLLFTIPRKTSTVAVSVLPVVTGELDLPVLSETIHQHEEFQLYATAKTSFVFVKHPSYMQTGAALYTVLSISCSVSDSELAFGQDPFQL